MPSLHHLHPSRDRNAGFLTFEAAITYPYYPLAGQTVLVVGDYEHSGVGKHPRNCRCSVVPRLPVGQLVLLTVGASS